MWKKYKCMEEVTSEECEDIKKAPACKKEDKIEFILIGQLIR